MDLVTEIRKIPPVTRTLCIALAGITLPVLASMVHPYRIVFIPKLVLQKLEIWRPFTSFFLGSGGINFIFDMAMLYRYANDLESGPYMRKSADLCWQIIWANALIMVASIPVHSVTYFRPFLHCLAYLSSALAPVGAQTSIYGLVTLPIRYQPYIMLLFELLFGGPSAVASCLPGTLVGHIWWWGIWGAVVGGGGGRFAGYGRAPRFLENYFRDVPVGPGGGPGAGRGANQGSGVHITAPRRFANDTRQSETTASGHSWGSGRRLG